MSRTRNTIITGLATALMVAAVAAPSAGATPSAGSGERTATELGQAVGEPGNGNGKFARTPTELGQSTDLSPSPTRSGESDGVDWGPVAIVGGSVLALTLIGLGGVALARRRGTVRKSRAPAVSS
jgi:hypothetical protein